jgi:hypothetical protein
MPPPPGMDKVYRNFWGGVIIKATLTTVLASFMAGLWDDEEDKDWRKEEFLNNFRRLRWTGINVSGVYKSLGMDVSANERRIFSVVGHFADPLKLIHPEKLIKGKGSPLTRIATAALSKSDWRDRPYNSVSEWINTGSLKKKTRYEPKENFWEALPAIAADQVINMQPIQFGHLLRYLQGEEDGLSAIMSSAGAHIVETYEPKGGYEFADIYKNTLKTLRRYKALKESGETKNIAKYQAENKDILRNAAGVKKTYSLLNHFEEMIKAIQKNTKIGPLDKRRRIKKLRQRMDILSNKFMINYNIKQGV